MPSDFNKARKHLNAISLLLVIFPLMLFSGCGFFQVPKAKVEVTPLHVGISNLDVTAWEKCVVIINAKAGQSSAYQYALGNVEPAADEMVFLTQFAQKDGKRFLPILSKVQDVTLKCRNPGQPFHYQVQ